MRHAAGSAIESGSSRRPTGSRKSSKREQRTQLSAASTEAEEAAAAAAAEAAWLADNFRTAHAPDAQYKKHGGRQVGGDHPAPQDPDIPDWCMRNLTIPDSDADAQPKGSQRSNRSDEANLPRDAEKECIICQEEKRDQWRALPCAHIFHDKCVKEWLQQNPSCPVCRTTFPTLQAGHAGPGSQAEAWLGSTAVATTDGKLSAYHQVLLQPLAPLLLTLMPSATVVCAG